MIASSRCRATSGCRMAATGTGAATSPAAKAAYNDRMNPSPGSNASTTTSPGRWPCAARAAASARPCSSSCGVRRELGVVRARVEAEPALGSRRVGRVAHRIEERAVRRHSGFPSPGSAPRLEGLESRHGRHCVRRAYGPRLNGGSTGCCGRVTTRWGRTPNSGATRSRPDCYLRVNNRPLDRVPDRSAVTLDGLATRPMTDPSVTERRPGVLSRPSDRGRTEMNGLDLLLLLQRARDAAFSWVAGSGFASFGARTAHPAAVPGRQRRPDRDRLRRAHRPGVVAHRAAARRARTR